MLQFSGDSESLTSLRIASYYSWVPVIPLDYEPRASTTQSSPVFLLKIVIFKAGKGVKTTKIIRLLSPFSMRFCLRYPAASTRKCDFAR